MQLPTLAIATSLVVALGVLPPPAMPAPSAQAGPARPGFEVASVKLHGNADVGPRGISFSPSGRFAWNAMTLRQLLSSAYAELEFQQTVGGPGWIDSQRFDIAATSPDALSELTPDGAPLGLFRRLRTLLEDRFQLKVHVENRELPVYALEPAATPIVMGRSLRRSDVDCEAVNRQVAAGRPPERPAGQPPPCSLRPGPGQLEGHAVTMARLTSVLAGPAGRPVVDRTGFDGTF